MISNERELFQHIASGYDGRGMSTFASTGVITDDLFGDISRNWSALMVDNSSPKRAALDALDSYVDACIVTVWKVGRNRMGATAQERNRVNHSLDIPGAELFIDYTDALSEYTGNLEDISTSFLGGRDEYNSDGESEQDRLTSEVEDHLMTTSSDNPQEVSFVFGLESQPYQTEWWIKRTEMTVSDYLTLR